jgi:hypothetical protein
MLFVITGRSRSLGCKIFNRKEIMEAAIGIEPMDKGFADLCLTTWLRRLIVKRKAKACLLLAARVSAFA